MELGAVNDDCPIMLPESLAEYASLLAASSDDDEDEDYEIDDCLED